MIENHRFGGEPTFRAAFRYGDRERASRALMHDLEGLIFGEPSQSFYPPAMELDPASERDIQNRIDYQNERCVELLHHGGWDPANLPISWRKYFINHWDQIIGLVESGNSSFLTSQSSTGNA